MNPWTSVRTLPSRAPAGAPSWAAAASAAATSAGVGSAGGGLPSDLQPERSASGAAASTPKRRELERIVGISEGFRRGGWIRDQVCSADVIDRVAPDESWKSTVSDRVGTTTVS